MIRFVSTKGISHKFMELIEKGFNFRCFISSKVIALYL